MCIGDERVIVRQSNKKIQLEKQKIKIKPTLLLYQTTILTIIFMGTLLIILSRY